MNQGTPLADPRADAPARKFLFLQGVASPFFRRLARTLKRRGHSVIQISFNGGDALFWLGFGGYHYRGAVGELGAYLAPLLKRHAITDLVAFGDCRPIHKPALELAKAHGLRLHLFEEGYLRPGWITYEPTGINGYTSLPRDAESYDQQNFDEEIPAPSSPPEGLGLRGVYDVAYHIANFVLSPYFHRYQNHRRYRAYQEYAGWAQRHAKWLNKRRRQRQLEALLQSGNGYFLFPLQLEGDTQITEHSHYNWISEVIKDVVTSFATHARGNTLLLVKRHPLDTGHVDHAAQIEQMGRELGITDRLHFFEGGDLETLVQTALGVVMINSTVGMMTLEMGRPLMALGTAVYKVPGLIHEGTLDDFWTRGAPPNAALFQRFKRVLISRTQIRGNYYTRAGIATALPQVVARLEGIR